MVETTATSDLVIRARDLTSQTVREVTDNVRQLSAALEAQSRQADRGEGSAKGFAAAIKNQATALKELLAQQGQLAQFQNTLERFATAVAGEEKAREAFAALKAELAGLDKLTKDQTSSLKELENAQKKATSEAVKAEKAYFAQEAAMQRLGINSANLASSQARVAETTLRAQAAFAGAERSQATFNLGLQRQKTLAEEAAAAQAGEVGRLKAIEQANRDRLRVEQEASQAQFAQWQAEQRFHAENLRRVDERIAKERELARFRNLGAQAVSQAPLTSPLAASPTGLEDQSRASAAMSALLAPAAAARASLEGVTAEVNHLIASMNTGATTTERYRDDLNTLVLASNEIRRQAGLIDTFRAQEAATLKAKEAVDQLRERLTALSAEMAKATAVDAQLERELKSTASQLERASSEYERQNTGLTRAKVALDSAKIGYHDLEGAVASLGATAMRIVPAVDQLQTKLTTGGNRGAAGRLTLFGLEGWQLTNLSYQINDVVTQLASGTSLTQTMAQQGGQFFQIFQSRLAGLVPYLGRLLAALPAVVAGVLALQRAMSDISSARGFEARLIATSEASTVTGRQLTAAARQIQLFGASFKDAQSVVQIFLQEGLNPDRMVEFGRVAQNVADVYGKSLPEAAKQVSEAFRGNFDAIVKLNDTYHFLTTTTYEQIKAAFDEGKANEARTQAFNLFAQAQQRAADKANGEWTNAVRGLTGAWNRLMSAIADSTVIQYTIRRLTDLASVVERLLRLTGSTAPSAGQREIGAGVTTVGIATSQRDIENQRRQVQRAQEDLERATTASRSANVAAQQQATAQMQESARRLFSEQNTLRALEDQYSAMQRLTPGERARAGNAALLAQGTQREAIEAQKLADTLRDARESRGDPRLRGAEADAADKLRLEQFERRFREQAQSRGITNITGELKAEFDRQMANERRRITEERQQQFTQERFELETQRRIAQADRTGRRGPAALEQDRALRDAQYTEYVEDGMRRLGLDARNAETRREFEQKNAGLLSAFRRSLDEGDERRRAQQGRSGANQRLNAEENLASQLLALRARLDRADRTNLDARKRAVDEEFDRYKILAARMGRRGAGTDDFLGNIEQLREAAKQEAEQTFHTERLNRLLAARKQEYAAINEEMAQGSITVQEGFRRVSEVTSRIGGQIREAAREAVEFGRKLQPTARNQAFLATQQRRANQSEFTEAAEGVNQATVGAMEHVNKLIRERTELEQAERTLQTRGAQSRSDTEERIRAAYAATTPEIARLTEEIAKQIDEQLALGRINQTTHDTWIAKLRDVRANAVYVTDEMRNLRKGIEESFVSNSLTAFDAMGKKLGEVIVGTAKLSDLFKAAGSAFASFAAGFLLDISKMILKALMLRAISATMNAIGLGGNSDGGLKSSGTSAVESAAGSALGSAAGSAASAGAMASAWSWIKSFFIHTGGVVGSSVNVSRPIDTSAFIGARRMHSGGVVGLQPDEFPTVLKRNEEVLSDKDPRNVLNSLKPNREVTSKDINLRQVLVMDPKDLSAALAGAHGEKVVMTHMRSNTAVLKRLVGK